MMSTFFPVVSVPTIRSAKQLRALELLGCIESADISAPEKHQSRYDI
jgi:hypothetical protein